MKTNKAQAIFDIIFWHIAGLLVAAATARYIISQIQLPPFK